MNRRRFVRFLAAGAALGVAGGAVWINVPRSHAHLSLDTMLDDLDKIPSVVTTQGQWDAFRTFNHLAQSVEFSMSGFPQQKSALFQNTAGRLAFKVFQAKGAMTHGLAEEIPGEVVAQTSGDIAHAKTRLQTALVAFKSYSGDLKPHFAYGALTKDEYALAHVLHVHNHMQDMRWT